MRKKTLIKTMMDNGFTKTYENRILTFSYIYESNGEKIKQALITVIEDELITYSYENSTFCTQCGKLSELARIEFFENNISFSHKTTIFAPETNIIVNIHPNRIS